MEVENVKHGEADFGDRCPDLRCATLYVARRLIRLNSIEMDFAEGSTFKESYLFSRRVVHYVVLVLKLLPPLSETLRLYRTDETVTFAMMVLDDLVVHSDSMVVILSSHASPHKVLNILLEEHPLCQELVVVDLAEVGCLCRVYIVEQNPIVVVEAAQDNDPSRELEVLKLKQVIVARIALHLHIAAFCLKQNRLCQLSQLSLEG